MKKNTRRILTQTLLIVIMSVICVIWMIPFLYMLITSFRDNDAINIYGFSFFPLADQLTLDNSLPTNLIDTCHSASYILIVQ